jgi:hypothetical protein
MNNIDHEKWGRVEEVRDINLTLPASITDEYFDGDRIFSYDQMSGSYGFLLVRNGIEVVRQAVVGFHDGEFTGYIDA